MYQVIIVIHIILGLAIIGLILMQQGKGADAGATFGGGASGSVFGAQGAASFLSRTTAILATLFFITSLGLAWLGGHKNATVSDIMSGAAVEKEPADLSLPPVGGTNAPKPVPMPTDSKVVTPPVSPDKPAVPDAVPAAPVDQPKPEAVTVPEAVQPKADVAPVVEGKKSENKTESPAKATEKKLKK